MLSRPRYFSLALGGVAFALMSSDGIAKDKSYLHDPLGHHRLLVVCLIDNEDNLVTKQLYDNTDWNGFNERDLFFIEMKENNSYTVAGTANLGWKRIAHHKDNNILREESGCRKNLDLVLIGNDGTQKRRWEKSIPPDELFDTIDAMPMRQAEIRYQKGQW